MSALSRALFTLALVSGAATAAHAQTPKSQAEEFNRQGKLVLFSDPQQAAQKFRQAIVLSPEGKYYYNLCVAEYSYGDFGNALMACQAVDANTTDDALKQKTAALIDQIKAQMKKQGMNPDEVGPTGGNPTGTNPTGTNPTGTNPTGTNPDGTNPTGTNPTGTNPTGTNPTGTNPTGTNPTGTQPQPALNRFRGAPPPSLFQQTAPQHDYTYTVGGALLGGSASIGDSGAYASAAGGFRLLGDLMFAPAAKVGAEGYLDFLTVGDGTQMQTGGMQMFDAGVGLYKHFCSGHLCVTPLGGAHLVNYHPASTGSSSSDFVSLGLRLQGAVGYAFGSRYEHVITASLGVDIDMKPIGQYDTPPTDPTIGLGKGGALVLFSIGYTYRFNTPFGQTPFFTLE